MFGMNSGITFFLDNNSQSIFLKKACDLISLASNSDPPNLLLGLLYSNHLNRDLYSEVEL